MVQFYQPKKEKKQFPKNKMTIERLDGLGQGIAFFDNKPIFMQNALPGEVVEAKIFENRKQFAKAKVLKLLTKSADRIEPLCSHYQTCGGCQLQHITFEKQHQIKRQHFDLQFKQKCQLNLSSQTIDWISDTSFQYRRRARFALYQDKKNTPLQFGFRKGQEKQIVDISNCPILTQKLQVILMPIKAILTELSQPEKLGHLDLLDVESGACAILRITAPLNKNDQDKLRQLAKTLHIQFYLHEKQLTLLEGNADLYYKIGDLILHFSPFDFIQVNAKVNQKMIEAVLSWVDFKNLTVLDLFCGMGNFSLPIAKRAKKVVGVEGVLDLVKMAQKNKEENKSHLSAEVDFYQADLSALTGDENWLNDTYDLILLDPARDGAAFVINHLIAKQVKQVIYISCNPATFARDMDLFLKGSYRIDKIKLIDMFPQTKHNESMILLTLTD